MISVIWKAYPKMMKTLPPIMYSRKPVMICQMRARIATAILAEVWSRELLKMEDNTHITDNVQFVIYDGATLLFRDKVLK